MKRLMLCSALLSLFLSGCQAVQPTPAPSATPKPLPKDMIFIPFGPFQMGCDKDHNVAAPCDDSEILHTVTLDAYLIDKYEVTNAQYADCVKAGKCRPPGRNDSKTRKSYYDNPEFANYPLIGINWDSAAAFCTWAGKRLPTEAEWEKAARGPTLRTYAWGDDQPTCKLANVIAKDPCVGDTSEVGSHPDGASPYGVMDMTGNVSEFVSDFFSDYSSDAAVNPKGPTRGDYRLARGGSWASNGFALALSRRMALMISGDNAGNALGFRCAATPEK